MGLCLGHCALHHFIVIPSKSLFVFLISPFLISFLSFSAPVIFFGLFFHLLPICSSVSALLQTRAFPSWPFCFPLFLFLPLSPTFSAYRGAAPPVQPMVWWPFHEELWLPLAERRWGRQGLAGPLIDKNNPGFPRKASIQGSLKSKGGFRGGWHGCLVRAQEAEEVWMGSSVRCEVSFVK